MKKLIHIALSGALLLGSAACTDLDLNPPSSAVPEVFFKDESSYKAFVARVYAGLAVTGQNGPAGAADISSLDEGFSNYLRQYWQFQTLTTEEAVIGWGDEGLPDLHNHSWTSANQFVRAMYYRIFFQVSMANEFLRETTDEKLDARGVSAATKADVKAYRAEARFLRALSYWHGIDLFGNIPFYTETDGIGSAAPRQASREEVFNFIESELNAIENDMVAPGANEYGRADRAAVWMLQAKLFLNAKVYTGRERLGEAVTASKKVIDSGVYSLQETYKDLFRTDNHNSNEIIFAIPFDGLSTQTWGGMTYLVHAPVGGSMNPADWGINGGWFGLRTTAAMADKFSDVSGNTDERALFYTDGQSKEINAISNFNDGYGLPKFSNVSSDGTPGADLNHCDTDFPMFRLADAYLMYAEATLRGGSGGDQALALQYVNELRQRAYNGPVGNISASDLTLDFILAERARELYWEGHRRTDLIRFGQFTDAGIWPWKGGVKEGRTTESWRNLLPIPAAELLANPNLQQNPGGY